MSCDTCNKHLYLKSLVMITMIVFYFFLIFHQPTVALTVPDDSRLARYIPQDNITIDCGSSGSNSASNHRIWKGDIDSEFFPSQYQNNASVTSTPAQPPIGGCDTPYQTARLSHSEFTYIFSLKPGQKFIRLHFYLDSYGNFESSKAFFSVKAAQYTLLSNFSASLNDDTLSSQRIVKEFCLNVEEGKALRITFSPIPATSDSYAFVNGIEVISMPNNLYYTADESKSGAIFVGQHNSFPIGKDRAMEMVYRRNVGGSFIDSVGDTGMFRTWETDDDYLTVPGYSVVPVDYTHELSFPSYVPTYSAPAKVYRTARSMGNKDRVLIKSYNLTWEFPVDSGFSYLLRLHFCEIQFEMNNTGDRNFFIFIAGESAELNADVIQWSGAKYAPVYRDYVVTMSAKGGVNLSIALQANPEDWRSTYADAILNGVEIFKLSNSDGNLAGSNPNHQDSPSTVELTSKLHTKGKNSSTAIIGIVSGVVSGLFVLFVIVFLIFRRVRKAKNSISVSTTKSIKTSGSFLPSDWSRYFTLAEIKAATKNFDDTLLIGRGGFGNVYKGYIDGGATHVAIKRLKQGSSQGAQEFKSEIEMLSQLRHQHLVSLIGYCNDDDEMILVYDYMARGTLQEHLYNSDNPSLSWKRRLQICIGAAQGLHYLHAGATHTIIHRDVKTTNILLNEKWEAKVSDFGLSKVGPNTISKSHVTTLVKGSLGYLDPEYYRRQQLTEKSDVYAFGVVLCEVLCARSPIVRSVQKSQMSLAEWAQNCYHDGTFDEIVDKHLRGTIAPECLRKYGEIAVSCMVDNGSERPSMNDVVWGLEFALELQKSAEDSKSLSGALNEMKGEDEVPFVNYREVEDEGKFSCSWESTSELNSSQTTITSCSDANHN